MVCHGIIVQVITDAATPAKLKIREAWRPLTDNRKEDQIKDQKRNRLG